MRELRQLGWWNGVIPLQKIITSEVTRALAGPGQRVIADNDQVQALSDSADALATRLERLVRAGLLTRGEAREALGYEHGPADEVYLLPLGVSPLPAGMASGSTNGNGNAPKALLKHSHTLTEERLVESAPRRRATPAQARLATAIDQVRRSAEGGFASALERIFGRLGREAARLARELETEERSAGGGETKQFALEELLDGLDLRGASEELRQAFAAHYLGVATEMAGEISRAFGIEFILSDPIQQEILQAGGSRAGLIDLEVQTRDAIFDALAEGREQGLAGDNLARFIRNEVEAGPWRDAATRARVIARTEAGEAANASTLLAARSMANTSYVMVHDNRTGFGDDVCTEIDGRVITIEEAEAIGLAHPNCTRSFTPVPDLLLEEMGLAP
jgi:hypothetical protein